MATVFGSDASALNSSTPVTVFIGAWPPQKYTSGVQESPMAPTM